jgi:uroporphyrinogen-III synthase
MKKCENITINESERRTEMGKGLEGKRVVLGASRKTEEMSALIHKQGGTASVRPLQGTVLKAGVEIESAIRSFALDGADWVVLTTGIGLQTLLEQAENLGLKQKFIEQLKASQVASRGYKTAAALKKLDIQAVVSDDDGTTQGLIRQMQDVDLKGKKVMVQLHGEKAPSLIEFLEGKDATISLLLPYQHIAPETETLESLCNEMLNGEVDAVCFTTAIQVHWLFHYVKKQAFEEKVMSAFNTGKIVATAVGKVTAEALKEEGISKIIVPNHERMGAMIVELAQYYERLSL